MFTRWLLDTDLMDMFLCHDSLLDTKDAAEQRRNPIFIFMVTDFTVLSVSCFCTKATCSLQIATFLNHKAHRHMENNTSKGKTNLENRDVNVDNGMCDAHKPWVVRIS